MTTGGAPRICQLRFGNPGVRQTVALMWRMLLDYSPRVRDKAESILRAYRVQFSPDSLQAAALYDWVQHYVGYVRDHVMVEELRGPNRMLDEIATNGSTMGDCDDFAILLGALLASIGATFTLAVVSDNANGVFSHVFLNLESQASGRIVLDPIGKDEQGRPARFGWHVPWELVTGYEEFPMPESYEGMGITPGGALAS